MCAPTRLAMSPSFGLPANACSHRPFHSLHCFQQSTILTPQSLTWRPIQAARCRHDVKRPALARARQWQPTSLPVLVFFFGGRLWRRRILILETGAGGPAPVAL